MPIYEYVCDDCGTKFEKLIRRPAADQVLCPACGQGHLTQALSVFSAHANGAPQPSAGGCPAGMCRTPNICGRN